ncbi:MAG: polysaccharide deacetylase family protein [Flavobacteriales bacterium]|nr:polysaccharide deacetylase family protein [Flavobacteriales bacterium]
MRKNFTLNYHSILPEKAAHKNFFHPVYSVREKVFRQHLELIKESAYKVIGLDEWYSGKLDEDNVLLTFDDGYVSDYKTVFPLLEEYGFKGTFFISLKHIEGDNSRWVEYREMLEAGHSIEAHGVSHKYLNELSNFDELQELVLSKKTIEDKLGQQVSAFSYPGGKYTKRTIDNLVEAGYRFGFTTNYGWNGLLQDTFRMNRFTVKFGTNSKLLSKHLQGNGLFTYRKTASDRVKKALSGFVGSKLADQIDYSVYA